MGGSGTFSLSGSDCVVALRELGFMIVRQQPGLTMLKKNRQLIFIPDLVVLPRTMLDSILTDAGVSLYELLQALDEIPTNPDLRALR
jgi:hypothetical protein